MYESMSYEKILQKMLDSVSDQMDKREGSIIYDALAPAAMSFMQMYLDMERIMLETFADTASREYLIRRAAERGLSPSPATYAILKGVFNITVPIGSRFSLNDLNYVVKEGISETEYQMQCETIGEEGNKNFGQLIPIDYVEGLESAELTELLIPGEDDEDTDTFRQRYFDSFDSKAYGGNVGDYLNKTNALPGVGSTKVTPIWAGGGTVKLTILNSEFDKASDELIEQVQNTIDPTKDGHGIGIAPIGHIVTVDTTEEIEVNISTSIVFDEGYSFAGQKEKIMKLLEEYMLEIRMEWANQSMSIVRIAQIESRIMSVEGVLDISNTKINGSDVNLVLTKYQIPKLGGVVNV